METNQSHRPWQRPEVLLMLMAAAVPLSFATWQALINNFAYERAAFGGVEIGIMQSLREIPGFLSFAVVFLLLLVREQPLAIMSLLLLGVGTAATGFLPTVMGIYFTTVISSIGYHYYETVQTSLSLQWIEKDKTPEVLGKLIAAGSFSSVVVYGLIWVGDDLLHLDYLVLYLVGGGVTILIAGFAWLGFPQYASPVAQTRKLLVRKRYWLFYLLTFVSGARRQIFVVFASFLMVEKFGFNVSAIAALFLLNAVINIWLAPKIGRLIQHIGERQALVFEYIGLILVFTAYAFVDHPGLAAFLYIVDHLFFAMAIAISTYFQKIAEPSDIAASASMSFTISHIAAVVMPVVFGYIWIHSHSAVFLTGAALAVVSLLLALNIPRIPVPGNEVIMGYRGNRPEMVK